MRQSQVVFQHSTEVLRNLHICRILFDRAKPRCWLVSTATRTSLALSLPRSLTPFLSIFIFILFFLKKKLSNAFSILIHRSCSIKRPITRWGCGQRCATKAECKSFTWFPSQPFPHKDGDKILPVKNSCLLQDGEKIEDAVCPRSHPFAMEVSAIRFTLFLFVVNLDCC